MNYLINFDDEEILYFISLIDKEIACLAANIDSLNDLRSEIITF